MRARALHRLLLELDLRCLSVVPSISAQRSPQLARQDNDASRTFLHAIRRHWFTSVSLP